MSDHDYTPQQLQAYNALQVAAERIGFNGWRREVDRHKMTLSDAERWQRYHKRSLYTPTAEHITVIETMPKVLTGETSPEEAMALLWQYDVMKQRVEK